MEGRRILSGCFKKQNTTNRIDISGRCELQCKSGKRNRNYNSGFYKGIEGAVKNSPNRKIAQTVKSERFFSIMNYAAELKYQY